MNDHFWNACYLGQASMRLFLWGLSVCLAGPGMGPPGAGHHGNLLWATAVFGFVVEGMSAWMDISRLDK